MNKKRMQITLDPYDKENAEKMVRAEYGLSLNDLFYDKGKRLPADIREK